MYEEMDSVDDFAFGLKEHIDTVHENEEVVVDSKQKQEKNSLERIKILKVNPVATKIKSKERPLTGQINNNISQARKSIDLSK